jgi:hypothetical protein
MERLIAREARADFKAIPVGVANAGAWYYAFVDDIISHAYPELMGLSSNWRVRRSLEVDRYLFPFCRCRLTARPDPTILMEDCPCHCCS